MKVFEIDIMRDPQSVNQFNDFMRMRRRVHRPRPLLIHHKMDGCPYCIRMHPMWRQLAAELHKSKPQLQSIELNRNSLPQIEDVEVANVAQFPRLQIHDGTKLHTFEGSPQVKEEVEKWVDSLVSTPISISSPELDKEELEEFDLAGRVKNKKSKSKSKSNKGRRTKKRREKKRKSKSKSRKRNTKSHQKKYKRK